MTKTDTPVIKDSGKRQEFGTGSVRDTRDGKGRFDLLPTRALRRVAKHFENGAKKYGPNNWRKGQPLSRYMDSALRHTMAHLEGQRDEPHLDAAIWNLLALAETEEMIKADLLPQSLNDLLPSDTLPKKKKNKPTPFQKLAVNAPHPLPLRHTSSHRHD